uniref:NADH dehydrogenase [ubiquinone] 1 beta subcomplex subunit 3 n=1 Tax=Tabanus bromius TaxID=304241 RepID=A0A0K8TNQ9_TABBR
MGGHGHAPYKVPDPSIYKVENAPQLLQVQQALARQGLKDPWLRNEVWRYDPKHFGTHRSRLINFLFRGFPYGFAAFVLTIGAEFALSRGKGHGHGHEHHGDH